VIRVLVAEDSAVTREFLVALLRSAGFEVVGAALDGAEAVAETKRLRPDVIVMDVHMPRMDGLEATRRIMAAVPTPIVLVSATTRDDVALGFEALKAGAVAVSGKPAGPEHPDHDASARDFLKTVELMAEVKVVRRWPRREARAAAAGTPMPDRKVRLVALGASTGGPAILAQILGDLSPDLEAPLLIVQHITPGFAFGLAEWLAKETRMRVKLAEPNETVRGGVAYVAPDGVQMGIRPDGRIHLAPRPGGDGLCPSASYLFESVAAAYGRSAMGVLLTGMGQDGAAGLRRLRLAGGITVAQDEATSIVFGMPAEAVRLEAAEYILPPPGIARFIRALVGGREKG
jgi:two-component system chemotaxis response regulator CheB